jgi:flagellar biosynthesis protein FlhA
MTEPRPLDLPPMFDVLVRARALLVPVAFLMLVVVLLVPLPPALLDVLLAMNMALAAVILLTTISMPRPLDFSVFPALLLATTLVRLVLNIASTRLILSADAATPEGARGMAGHVIESFASFVAGSSLVVGTIIFAILVVIQFVVITRGAARMSEVAARFTLDAMPGKQMAIDADLAAGMIDDQEAHRRREAVNREADFYGAMDGASRFVRGDVVASVIITAVNIVGGFAIGVFERGWTFAESLDVFTRLTIGDGLVTQIPSFLLAIAAGMVVARTGGPRTISEQIPTQLASQPTALFLIAILLVVLAATPLPSLPLLVAAVGLTAVGLSVRRLRARVAEAAEAEPDAEREDDRPPPLVEAPVEDLLGVDALELEIGYGLVPIVDRGQGGALLDRIGVMRRELAQELGIVVPAVRIRDSTACGTNEYRVKLRGAVIGEGSVDPRRLLALDSGATAGEIPGRPAREPVYGVPAWWIEPDARVEAEALHYTVVDSTSVIVSHLTELVRRHAAELLTREAVNDLIEQLRSSSPKLVDEIMPDIVRPGEVQRILQNLLRERVPVRDLETILEALGDWASHTRDHDDLTEYVRHALRRTICARHAERDPSGASTLHCASLDPTLERTVASAVERSASGSTVTLPLGLERRLVRAIERATAPLVAAGHARVIVAAPYVRRPLHAILEPHVPNLTVLSVSELVRDLDVRSVGLVHLPPEEESAPSGVVTARSI